MPGVQLPPALTPLTKHIGHIMACRPVPPRLQLYRALGSPALSGPAPPLSGDREANQQLQAHGLGLWSCVVHLGQDILTLLPPRRLMLTGEALTSPVALSRPIGRPGLTRIAFLGPLAAQG